MISCEKDNEKNSSYLIGKWNWTQCIPSQFDCMEQPSDVLKRSILFLRLKNDSLSFITYRNDTAIKAGQTKLNQEDMDSWIIYDDIVFGKDSIIYSGKEYILEKINNICVWIRLGNTRSSLVYEYKKE